MRSAAYPDFYSRLALLAVGLVLGVGLLPQEVLAQRPFRFYDPFYRSETARRAFHDGYAASAELSYRSRGGLQEGNQASTFDPLGLSLHFDYQLLSQVDLSAFVDASPSEETGGRTLTLSWIAIKYYRTVENTDYAFRLAVDPAFDGSLGFPQMDAAFISTSLLSSVLSSDYAIGVRRVRKGIRKFIAGVPDVTAGEASLNTPDTDIILMRAIGWELHFMMQYSLILNPARSNVFLSLLVDRGQYDLFKLSLRDASQGDRGAAMSFAGKSDGLEEGVGAAPWKETYQGGAVWLRSGIEYNRPAYQVMPFLSLLTKQWVPEDYLRQARISFGVRLTLR